jgi:hypothetical protein
MTYSGFGIAYSVLWAGRLDHQSVCCYVRTGWVH